LNYAAGKERQKVPKGWLRIELRGGQGAAKSPEDGCALNYAAGKERQKAPKGLRGPRFIRSADIF